MHDFIALLTIMFILTLSEGIKQKEKTKKLEEPFSKVLIISLKRHVKRFAAMSEVLKQINLPISLYEAIDGSKIPPASMVCRDGYQFRRPTEVATYFRTRFNNGTLFDPLKCYNNNYSVYDLDTENKWKWKNSDPVEPLKIACWQSHLQIYFEIASEKPKAPVLILEDDVEIPKNFKETAIDILQRLPNNWEIFFFGFRALPPPRIFGTKNGFAQLKFVVNAHAYAVRNARAAKKLIAIANTEYAQMADRVWQEALYNGTIIAYCPGNKAEIISQNKRKFGTTFNETFNSSVLLF